MTRFDPAFDITLKHEGGYVNDPLDRGGETYKGIARRHWPQWDGWALVDAKRWSDPALDKAVRDFYRREFWDRLRLGELRDQRVANELFDTAVNQGTATAARYLQEAVSILGRPVTVDGKVGPMTITAANAVDGRRLFNLINIIQGERYLEIIRKDPAQVRFLNGWLTRVEFM